MRQTNSVLIGTTNANYTGDFDAKQMLLNAVGSKMRYKDRMTVRLTQDTQYCKAGQVISPSKVKGQALIDQGLAVKVKRKDD